ncbi:alpha-2-macroglobulin [Gelidibacter salicanalis]|uniref:Alpha-2-macroglobulin n=1 Tax=Gelidibacter salicanalis TaxID=291193 RepID=A0A5C7AXR9_9FLAO|nr:alpha-2-macroglobulin family protein [Gelidibacter salicanalis]TXE10532.1 alpha-2-macroglobulin [Gelidibacter salicanalis]
MIKHIMTVFVILLFSTVTQAQSNSYENLWKKVENFEKEGLPKSALEVVEQISKMAVVEKTTTQNVKSLLYKSKYALILEEDAQLKVVNDFKSQIAKSKTPTKNILENMLANLYWQYFQNNRYRFYNRTQTEEKVNADDFRTWDLKTLFQEIDCHYENSLQHEEQLQKTALSNFDDLLHLEKESKVFRSTLFDFLSHNALEFYQTDEIMITQPAYKFTIDALEFLADAKTFSELKITHQDSTSLQLKALKIYQNLIDFHLKDNESQALADVDIKRLQFVKTNSTLAKKDAIYLKSLKKAAETYKNHEVSALFNFEIASLAYYKNTMASHQDDRSPSEIDADRWNLKEALALCDAVLKQFPKSKGAEKCAILRQLILKPTLQLTVEKNIPIQTHNLMLMRYSNLKSVAFKAIKLTATELDRFNKTYRKDERLAFIKTLKSTEEWQNELKDEQDYQQHSTEIVIPKLPNGLYLIVATPEESDDSFYGFDVIQVSNVALVTKSGAEKELFQLINRTNAHPLVGAKVSIKYQENYNNSFKTEDFVTNSNGEFTLTTTKNRYYNMDIAVNYNGDVAFFKDHYTNGYYNDTDDEAKITYRPFVFTDRSIYRPGQTVYFKGIATKTENGKTVVYANQEAKLSLKNVNGELVKEMNLKTNEYGSVSGEFILPNDGLNGNYSIIMLAGGTGSTNFSVEEYKRPKFETTFNPITETFKVHDSISIKGKALAYAGSSITDAKVVYRVHRKVQYPRWYYWSRPYFNSQPQEIAHGETTTDKDGNFKINFKAIPDESVDKANLPFFNYEITADVTDLNGETRSATSIVNVGYHALLATVSIDDQLDKTKKDHQLTLTTKNLNGEFVPATGTVKIYKLKAPNEVLRPRPWAAPDYPALSREEFKKLFPHEAYQDEHNLNTWEKGALVFEVNFDTSKSKTIDLGTIKKWDSGNYVVVLESKDRFGQLVKDEAQTFVFSPEDKTLPDHQLFSVTTDQSSYTKGQNVIITFGSAADDVMVTVDVEKNQNIIKTYLIPLSNNKKTIAVPVTEEDLGGFAIHYSFAAFNSFESGTKTISVPYPKSELTIETKTFRDKLEPGSNETWSFNIKGPQGDKVSAELLASMYDMSLDQFTPHQWQFSPLHQPIYYSNSKRQALKSFGNTNFYVYLPNSNVNFPHQNYDQWNWFGFNFGNNRNMSIMLRGNASGVRMVQNEMVEEQADAELEEVVVAGFGTQLKSKTVGSTTSENEELATAHKENLESVTIRKNLQETAFFYPQLQTDAEGNVTFSFTTPEALTKWKLQLLAHTKGLESGTTTLETVTQKEMMVIPNAPRFLRHGDDISISTKIANLTKQQLSGEAVLQLFDAITGQAIDAKLNNADNRKSFSVDAKGNTDLTWSLTIPDDVDAVQYKIIAKSADFSDGEQNVLPVLSNRMLVTETLPMWIRSNETRTFILDKLKSNTSSTLKNHKLTLEMTSNPAWYAVQALPYLMEYPYDNNEQTFSRFYANALASHIANSNPRIKEVFDQWASTDALLSNLEKNADLKGILISETPWLRDAQSETEQKKRMALLFDMNKMSNELQAAQRKLQNSQMNNGAWAWFEGGRPNRFITQQIITGFGHLKQLDVTLSAVEGLNDAVIKKAIAYLDAEFVEEYKDLRKYDKKVDLTKDHLSYTQLHYLYMRSFFTDIPKSKDVETITKYYQTQIEKYWLKQSLYAKGLMALVSHRFKDSKTAGSILKSLKENSITSDELGMYWKENQPSWFWYQAPVETQALMIEAFSEIQNDTKTIDNLKIWLLKNKQTNSWNTTKATTEAVYALLLQGSDWLSVTEQVEVTLGGKNIEPSRLENVKVEAGTGYYKTSWSGSEIQPEMADVTLTKKGDGIAWGGLYWQYFEDLDKITFAETPLRLQKKLFLKTNTDTGEKISEITYETALKVGDLVRVRIELRSDRDMEFIHMKDMRAAGFEPINVVSSYKYQDGLGYYESTKDAATNFFFDYLPKGIYVFEYDLRVNNKGNMSNGITTIQSMYAPEFTSHSEGVRVQVK